jgi:hypothetical protein
LISYQHHAKRFTCETRARIRPTISKRPQTSLLHLGSISIWFRDLVLGRSQNQAHLPLLLKNFPGVLAPVLRAWASEPHSVLSYPGSLHDHNNPHHRPVSPIQYQRPQLHSLKTLYAPSLIFLILSSREGWVSKIPIRSSSLYPLSFLIS